MLRLKQAINDCGISQQAVVQATGFSKTQVSLTLNRGALPVNAEKFTDGVVALVQREPKLEDWLSERNFNVERLFDNLAENQKSVEAKPTDLAHLIYRLAGQATIDGGLGRETALRLVKATHLLSLAAMPQIAAEAAAILAGGSAT
jgi:hypothetical protein